MYVNVYEVTRCYGGAEEGGWYYDAGTVVVSIKVADEAEAEAVSTAMKAEYPYTGYRSSVVYRPDFDVCIEPHEGESYPTWIPRYE